jgi:tryptophanyl-tRNA synthetase
MVVTPWNVSGAIDYDKLIRQFGTQYLSEQLLERIKRHSGELHPHLRRGVFFSHRDLGVVLDEYEDGSEFVLYTGRGPSGPVHLGHLVPWMFTKHLQDVFGAQLFFQITEDENLLIRREFDEGAVRHWAFENALDLMALGFDPGNTELMADLRHVEKLYGTALKVAKRITMSTAKAVFGFGEDSNIGIIFFPAMQAAPCFIASERRGESVPCLIPAGIDQDPYWRMTRDVASKLGYPKPAQVHNRLLPGLVRGVKMSSSEPETAIYTTDDPEVVEEKVRGAYTSETNIENQGRQVRNARLCSIYQYYYFLFEESDEGLKERLNSCNAGAFKCDECKAELADRVNLFLKKHQIRREKLKVVVEKMLA